MNLTVAILAAGQSRRFGSPKQLASIDGIPMLGRVVDSVRQSGCSRHLVVLGAHYQQIRSSLDEQTEVLFNPDWQSGMASSIRHVLTILKPQCSHLMIVLGDQPGINNTDLANMIALAGDNPDSVVATDYPDSAGVPAVFPRRYFAQLAELKGDQGARKLLSSAQNLLLMSLPEAADDIDTPLDLSHFLNSVERTK